MYKCVTIYLIIRYLLSKYIISITIDIKVHSILILSGKNNTAHRYCNCRIRLRFTLVRNGQFKIDDDGHRNEIFPCEFCPSLVYW